MKDKAWTTWVRSSHAGILSVGVRIHLSTQRTSNPVLTSVGSSYNHQLAFNVMLDIYKPVPAVPLSILSLSRISGLAPTSLPVIFSRMVDFPAFRRPMISKRKRLHNRLRSSDERSMLVRYTSAFVKTQSREIWHIKMLELKKRGSPCSV